MPYFTPKTTEQLCLAAIFEAKPGKTEELKKRFLALIEITRREEGCVSYHLYEDRENPDRLIFHEIWANQTYWEKHMETQHIKDILAASDLFHEPILQRWERSEAPDPVIEKDSLVLFAYNRTLPGKEKEWQKILEDLIAPTMAEKGALHYELHVSRTDPRDFMFHETWRTVEDWNNHMTAPHLIDLLKIIEDYTVNGISVIKTKPVI